MSSVDISPNTGAQNASVHLGTWVGGETLAQNEIPTSGSASMSGAAVMNVAYRYNQTGTNYDVHKYTTTADVAASFTWGNQWLFRLTRLSPILMIRMPLLPMQALLPSQ